MTQGPVIGVLSPWFGGTYFGGLLGGIMPNVAAGNGRLVAIQTLDAGTYSTDYAEPPPFHHRVAWEHVQGFIVFLNAANTHYLRAAQEMGRPVVVISDDPVGVECPEVFPDNHSGVRAATAHLLEHGHRRIAFAGHVIQQDICERHEAYAETLLAHGITPDPALLFDTGDMQESGGELAARAMLAAGLPSTAVIVGNDPNAIGLMRVLTEAGYDLPNDQAVVGFDDLPGTAYLTPSLTTVRQPLGEVGALAVQLLTRLVNGEAVANERHRVTTTLVVRESCGCPGPLSITTITSDAPRVVRDTEELLANICAELELAAPEAHQGVRSAELAFSAKSITVSLRDAVAGTKEMSGLELRRALLPISDRVDSYESVVTLMRLIRDHGRSLQAATGTAEDTAVTRRVEDAIYQIFVQLAQAQSSLQAAYGKSTMSALGTQYLVSMQLLRSQERDPRSLDWLRTTDIRGGCLGLWPVRSSRADKSSLDIITTFDRAAEGHVTGGSSAIELFPPADVIAMADIAAGDMVYIAHLKVGTADWGMLALVGPIEATLAEGRETMNQWAALLSVALEHDAVLNTMREQEEYLRRAALYDELTGLPNRAHFRDRLTVAMARTARRPGNCYAVLLLDLDGFKLVNDSLGHEAGDLLLQEVARRLVVNLRPTDTAARLGGDEFAVLIEDFENAGAPPALAERLQEMLSAPYHLAGTDVMVSASIGIAPGAEGYADTQAVMRDADAAMYFAKARGKRAHAMFAPSMHASAVNRLQIQGDLRHALDNDELRLYYQPIVELSTGQVSGAEALIRWQHPTRGLLAPGDFLPVAEESHLSLRIGGWVLQEACRQAQEWRGEVGGPSFTMSVNVSNRQFWHSRLIDDVSRCLEAGHLDPGSLALEITEGVIMYDVKLAAEMLTTLSGMGIGIHIDDFGTGYSSLQALQDLSFDALKIDRSFISQLTTSPRSKELVRTIVTMGRNLNLDIIAEGIEEPAELDSVRDLGCTHGQGYLYSRPVPADAFTAYLLAHTAR
jgi:diguanylate cyclase (GGDEF)-like protein